MTINGESRKKPTKQHSLYSQEGISGQIAQLPLGGDLSLKTNEFQREATWLRRCSRGEAVMPGACTNRL